MPKTIYTEALLNSSLIEQTLLRDELSSTHIHSRWPTYKLLALPHSPISELISSNQHQLRLPYNFCLWFRIAHTNLGDNRKAMDFPEDYFTEASKNFYLVKNYDIWVLLRLLKIAGQPCLFTWAWVTMRLPNRWNQLSQSCFQKFTNSCIGTKNRQESVNNRTHLYSKAVPIMKAC